MHVIQQEATTISKVKELYGHTESALKKSQVSQAERRSRLASYKVRAKEAVAECCTCFFCFFFVPFYSCAWFFLICPAARTYIFPLISFPFYKFRQPTRFYFSHGAHLNSFLAAGSEFKFEFRRVRNVRAQPRHKKKFNLSTKTHLCH